MPHRVLSPLLFILYTSDFQYNSKSLSDEQEEECRTLVDDFVVRFGRNLSLLCVIKSREIMIDRIRK